MSEPYALRIISRGTHTSSYRYGLRTGGSGGNKSLANGGGGAKRGSSGTAAASTALSVGEAAAKSNQARVQVR